MELAKELASDKETIPDTLELLQAFYRDLLLYSHNRPVESLINIDLVEKIRRIAAQENTTSILNKLSAVNECQWNHERNVNPQLNMEVLLLRLAA